MSIDKSIHINVIGYQWNSVLIKLHDNSLHPNTELKNLLHVPGKKEKGVQKRKGVRDIPFYPELQA